MGFIDKLAGEFVDIIEWTDDTPDTMVWRFPRYHNQIKYGAQLTVRESQLAVFVNEGQIADVYKPGMYTLTTRNMPVLSTLRGWKHGFDSPFRAEVYFASTRNFTDLKWGTRNPIILRDPEFGPVRLRAFGSYVVRVSDAARFVREITGTDGVFTLDGITEQLRNLIVTRFSDRLAESKIPVMDLAANYDELSELMTAKVAPEFQEYGLEITKLLVENISLPEEVERALDKRSSMGIVGNLDKYLKYQTGTAMEAAAANPGGDASAGVGMGMGFAMANQMAQSFTGQGAQAGGPPPLPGQQAVQY
ncbi:MAG: antifreeze protein, partial [Chitinivibrionales bacterium]|nr:antifreeze protein [Chitinivibrionales bacterium]